MSNQYLHYTYYKCDLTSTLKYCAGFPLVLETGLGFQCVWRLVYCCTATIPPYPCTLGFWMYESFRSAFRNRWHFQTWLSCFKNLLSCFKNRLSTLDCVSRIEYLVHTIDCCWAIFTDEVSKIVRVLAIEFLNDFNYYSNEDLPDYTHCAFSHS